MEIPTKAEIESLKQKYPEGTVVELINMDDPQAPVPGTRLTVDHIDDMGQIWSKEIGLALVPGVDMFKKVDRFKVNAVDNEDLPARLYVLVDSEGVGFPGVNQSEPLFPESDWIHPLCTWLNLNIK